MSDVPAVSFLLQDATLLYGAEHATLDLMVGLQARGVPVQAMFIGETRLGPGADGYATAAREAGLTVERFAVRNRFCWSLARQVRRHLRQRPGAILHTTGYKAHLHGLLAAHGLAPSVTTIHGWLVRPDRKERAYEWLDGRLLRRDRAVICLTRHYEDLLVGKGIGRGRVHRIPTGLAPHGLPPAALAGRWPDGPWTVALIGRLSWEKNHALFLEAVARLRQAGMAARAIIAGTGPERGRIEAQVAALGLENQVHLAGYRAIAQLLPDVHAVCLCSRIENLPLSLMEAMAWERPVVATRVGGIPDLVEDGVTGWLVPGDDAEALARALGQCAADEAVARARGRAGRLRVEREFTLAASVDRHLALYRRLAGDPPGRRPPGAGPTGAVTGRRAGR
jgi:glycosyltransferase involved in cell wall biosynthesis